MELFLVELARRYSNRPELLNPLVRVMSMIHTEPSDTTHHDRPSVEGANVVPWRISDRFAAHDIDVLIAAYRSGQTAPALAKRYDIGLTSVKRLLRDRGVRKR